LIEESESVTTSRDNTVISETEDEINQTKNIKIMKNELSLGDKTYKLTKSFLKMLKKLNGYIIFI
jgi:hypothetical protein